LGCLPLVLGGMLAVAGGLVVLGKAQAWGVQGMCSEELPSASLALELEPAGN